MISYTGLQLNTNRDRLSPMTLRSTSFVSEKKIKDFDWQPVLVNSSKYFKSRTRDRDI